MSEQTKSCQVLLIEDNIDVRESTLLLLKMAGYEAIGVDNGQDALYELCRMQELPCLILLDLMMPVMDGWEFYQELHRNAVFAEIPLIVVSAIDGDCAAFDNAVVRLQKPILVNQLVSAITRACDGKPCARLTGQTRANKASLLKTTA